MPIRIAFVGNPNCGKTTLFNFLTGSSEYVGNRPGVTVEEKSAPLKVDKNILVTDLPGVYSLSPYTPDELVTRDFLVKNPPDAVINVIDALTLTRSLFLATQLAEMGIPVVAAINMLDSAEKRGDSVNLTALSELLGCPVIRISAADGTGCTEIVTTAVTAAKSGVLPSFVHFSDKTETALDKISFILFGKISDKLLRFCAVKILERDKKISALTRLNADDRTEIEKIILSFESLINSDSETFLAAERSRIIGKITSRSVKAAPPTVTLSDKIDAVLTNPLFGLPAFAAAAFLTFFVSVTLVGNVGDFLRNTVFTDFLPKAAENALSRLGCVDWLKALACDGIIGGVGSVLSFLPQLAALFFALEVFEECGYMSRVAFAADRVFRKFGLSGKSFVPVLLGAVCGVPAVMSARTVRGVKDRRLTIMLVTFVPCSAKLPVIALVADTFFPESGLAAPLAYLVGIAAVICSGIILKKTKHFGGETTPFVAELPPFRIPPLKSVILHTLDNLKSFVIKVGTLIFTACTLIWLLSNIGFSDGKIAVCPPSGSFLALIGGTLAPLFSPLGFGKWQTVVASLTGIAAKENIVGTLGVLLPDNASLSELLTPAAACSMLIFNLLCAPCVCAISAARKELGSLKSTLAAVAFQTLTAYFASFVFYRLCLLFSNGVFDALTIAAFALLAAFLFLLLRPDPYRKK